MRLLQNKHFVKNQNFPPINLSQAGKVKSEKISEKEINL